jgi:adenine phosphoribosyltransferase
VTQQSTHLPKLAARALVRAVPDFPSPGILFRDITPVLQDPAAFGEIIDRLAELARAQKPDLIVGIESRGFIFGAPLALALNVGFVPVRKEGKLPHQTLREEYALEYGSNVVEIHKDAVAPGLRVVIVDDLLATGGTARAASKLVKKLGGIVAAYAFVIELTFLKGRDTLGDAEVHALIAY